MSDLLCRFSEEHGTVKVDCDNEQYIQGVGMRRKTDDTGQMSGKRSFTIGRRHRSLGEGWGQCGAINLGAK